MAGSAQRAATMACTWVAPWSVTWCGAADPLTTTRSAAWPSEQNDPPAGVLAPVTGGRDEPRVEAGGAGPAGGGAAPAPRPAAWPSEQNDPPAGVLAPVTGGRDEPRVEAGGAAPSAVALPHAASPIRAVAAIRTCTPRAAMRASFRPPWTVRSRIRFRAGHACHSALAARQSTAFTPTGPSQM